MRKPSLELAVIGNSNIADQGFPGPMRLSEEWEEIQ